MKNSITIYCLFLGLSLFWGCVSTTSNNVEMVFNSPTQAKFDSICLFYNHKNQNIQASNDFARKSLEQKLENEARYALGSFCKENIPVYDWEASISDISIAGTKGDGLRFYLKYEPEKYRRISLRVSYFTDNPKEDVFFEKMKTINNDSHVYFDGFFRLNRKKEPEFSGEIEYYPTFDFFVIDVRTKPNERQYSTEMLKAIELTKVYFTNFEKAQAMNAENVKGFWPMNNAVEKLNEDEKSYLLRFRSALFMNMMAAE